MPVVYCPTQGCGAATTYSGVKPSTCPKCHVPFASAFKVEAPKEEKVVMARKTPAPHRMKPRPPSRFNKNEPAPESTFMKPIGETEPAPEDSPPDDDTSDDSDFDENATDDEIATYAEELKASINENDIIIHLDEEGPVKYRDWCLKKPQ